MFSSLKEKILKTLKENFHLLIGINLFLSVLMVIFNSSGNKVELILVNDIADHGKSDTELLREVICKKAFLSLKNNKASESYIHPDIISFLKQSEDDDYNFKNIEKFYFKFESREICRVVAKTSLGYIAYTAVISSNGPLFYRVTSLEARKPTFLEIKGYL